MADVLVNLVMNRYFTKEEMRIEVMPQLKTNRMV